MPSYPTGTHEPCGPAAGVNVRAMVVNVNAPGERGTAFGVFNLTDDLGKGLGPVMTSLLIARLGRAGAAS